MNNKEEFPMRKNFQYFLITLLIFIITTTGEAEIKMYEGIGACSFDFGENDEQIENAVKARAMERAKQNAKEKAGIYLKSYSRSVNGTLTDDEISAITNNIIEVLNVELKKMPYEAYNVSGISYGEIGVRYEARVKVNIDTEAISGYLNLDESKKNSLIAKNKFIVQALINNEKNFEKLRKRASSINTIQEKNQIISEFNKIDEEFLANKKLDEGNILSYKSDYYGAISKYNEALELKPNYDLAYHNRALAYTDLGNYNQAISDFTKSIHLMISFDKNGENSYYLSEAYCNRGYTYYQLNEIPNVIEDCTKSIQLNSNNRSAYLNRSAAYLVLKKYHLAINDCDKAIQIDPNCAMAYTNRGAAYYKFLHNYTQALSDLNEALLLSPNLPEALYHHGVVCAALEDYKQALNDATKIIQLYPDKYYGYLLRGFCYQELGDTNKAQIDIARAKLLGFSK